MNLTPDRLGRRIAGAMRRVLGDRAGVAALEFALVGSLFFLFILGIVEVGRGLWTMNALNYAVQQAARCASINTTACGSQTNVRSFAVGVSAVLVPSSTFSLNPSPVPGWAPTCSTTTNNMVTASYQMNLFIPFVSVRPTLTAASCFPK